MAATLNETLLKLEQALDGDADTGRAALGEFLARIDLDPAQMEGFVSLLGECTARMEYRTMKALRMVARSKKDRTAVEMMREMLAEHLKVRGCREMQAGQHSLALVACGGSLPITVSLEDLPSRFTTQSVTVKADLTAIRQALLAGETVTGATLGRRGETLKID